MEKKDNLEFLITTVTLSSSQIAEIELKNIENAKHRFFPIDSLTIEYLKMTGKDEEHLKIVDNCPKCEKR